MEQGNRSDSDEHVPAAAGWVGSDLEAPLDGKALAEGAHYSRFHFQRLFRRTTGESPGSCRRRLRLERAGYQLLYTAQSVTEIAFDAGFDSLEGFSKAFRRSAGISPSHFRRTRPPSWFLPAPNDIHFDPVLGAAIRLARQASEGEPMDLTDILVQHDFWLTRRLLERAAELSDAQLDQTLQGFGQPLLYHDDSPQNLRALLDRLVFTKETWMASVHGRREPERPDRSVEGMRKRLERAFGEFTALARKVRDEKLWDSSFIDMLCEPPETFTYGGMIAHVLTFSAYRRTMVIEAFEQLGVTDLGYGDPIEWQRAGG